MERKRGHSRAGKTWHVRKIKSSFMAETKSLCFRWAVKDWGCGLIQGPLDYEKYHRSHTRVWIQEPNWESLSLWAEEQQIWWSQALKQGMQFKALV